MAGMNRAEMRLRWLVRDEWHVLTGSYALDALGPAERERFERHLHHCASCDAEVRGLRETAARLAMARSLRPPPGLQDRVIAATYRTRQLPPLPGGRPFPLRPARLLAARLAAVLHRMARLFVETWNDLNHPCSERAVCHAPARAERRAAAHDDDHVAP